MCSSILTRGAYSRRYKRYIPEAPVLGDDISFIQEVHAGETEAPGMDAAYELAQLKRKFEMWKREFR
eukprot:scaffold97421_cov19-Tisochrysis_lutea.AAC.1